MTKMLTLSLILLAAPAIACEDPSAGDEFNILRQSMDGINLDVNPRKRALIGQTDEATISHSGDTSLHTRNTELLDQADRLQTENFQLKKRIEDLELLNKHLEGMYKQSNGWLEGALQRWGQVNRENESLRTQLHAVQKWNRKLAKANLAGKDGKNK